MLELGVMVDLADIIPERDNEMVSVVDLVEVTSIVGSIAKVNEHFMNTVQCYTLTYCG